MKLDDYVFVLLFCFIIMHYLEETSQTTFLILA